MLVLSVRIPFKGPNETLTDHLANPEANRLNGVLDETAPLANIQMNTNYRVEKYEDYASYFG